MVKRMVASTVALLAVSAGVAYAATQFVSSAPTQVCVNDVTGLMRVDDTCRQGEHAITIGGGGNVQVTQNGTFTLDAGETEGVELPLSGLTVSGECEFVDPPDPDPYQFLLARAQLDAATGETLDAFGTGVPGDVIGGTSFLTYPLGATSSAPGGYEHGSGWTTVIATSNDATATVTVGGAADWGDQTCTYLWQAVETPN